MKRITLFVLLTCILTTGFAQKKSLMEKRAKASTEFITNEMSLEKEQSNLLLEALITRYESNTSKINGKSLTKEEKQKIYRTSHKEMTVKLASKFSKDEIKKVTELLRIQQQKKKKV